MNECCFHARKSLVQELAEGLRARGLYVPDDVCDPDKQSDIINCVFLDLDQNMTYDTPEDGWREEE